MVFDLEEIGTAEHMRRLLNTKGTVSEKKKYIALIAHELH